MSTPAVSVVLPTYNRAVLLPRAIESVMSQTFGDWEIVLVDDGSTDETSRVVQHYAKKLGNRFVDIRQDNQGSSAARNTGIDACRGRLVAFLDSDDEFLPGKLDRQLTLFGRNPDLGFVYSDYAYVDFEGVRHDSAFDTKCRLARDVPHQTVAPGLCVCSGDLFDALVRGYFIATIVGMVRREVLGDAIRFPVDLAYAEEWLFYLHVARACRAGFVDEPLCLHHYTPGSLARADKCRNATGYRDVLRAIDDCFQDMTREQRRAARGNLASASRQLGYDAYRAGRFRDAAGYFVESLRYRPGAGVLAEAAQAAGRSLVQKVSPRCHHNEPSRNREGAVLGR